MQPLLTKLALLVHLSVMLYFVPVLIVIRKKIVPCVGLGKILLHVKSVNKIIETWIYGCTAPKILLTCFAVRMEYWAYL